MYRKAAIVVSITLLAFTTACGSHKSASSPSSGSGSSGATGAPVSAATCPTQNTRSFAKTRFVADAALAGGAFKHWIYTPMKEGKFKKGTHGRIKAIVKAVAAGAFTLNRLNAAKTNAQASPLLCKLTIAPIAKFQSAISNIVHKGKTGSVDPSAVTEANSVLGQFHSGAAGGGAGFTDNQNANIGG
ncbi:MAG: hypothetical protein J2P26_13050 [Nocardiopsaceae bacterium]|nr:hypothetical protein [Nocardiopsaceae bacterium]